MIAVVALAYASQAPSLAVAEFSPAARQAVEPPPTTAATGATRGNRVRPETTAATTTTAPAAADAGSQPSVPTTRVARGRSCVGDPPRQIEDPMSPPCITAIFEGDNGGATSAGATSTEVRVAVASPNGIAGATSGGYKTYRDAVSAMFEFFNRRFEFYGRRLVPVFVDGATTDAVAARAHGATIAQQNVFGTLTGLLEEFATVQPALMQELVRSRIVTVTRGVAHWWEDRVVFDPAHPYLWSVYPSSEDLQSNLGEVACALAGKPASHAGDAGLVNLTRRFAVVAAGDQLAPSTRVLGERLAGCGVEPTRVSWTKAVGTDPLRTGLGQLRDGGATTVICVCDWTVVSTVIGQTHAAGFHPEWLLTPVNIIINEGNVQGWRSSGQMAPPIQLQPGPKILPVQSRPWFGAMQSVDAAMLGTSLADASSVAEPMYEQLLLLAAGVQGAGPALTPDSFAAALQSMQFPNPGAGQAPYWQPSVGFGPGDHSLYDDYAVAWWSDTAPALDVYGSRPTGSWCYEGQGARYRVGTYPIDLDRRLFDPAAPCR